MIDETDHNHNKILDIGAGTAPLRAKFIHAIYSASDVIQNDERTIDIVADVNEGLPMIKNNTYDAIISIQVIEHLKLPDVFFKECFRILKPKGKLYLSTNLCYQEHMVPNDFFRFTRYGLRYLGESHGLTVTHLEPQGGIFHTLGLILDIILVKQFTRENSIPYYMMIVLTTPMRFVYNTLFLFLDKFDRDKKWTVNYEVIYQKPN